MSINDQFKGYFKDERGVYVLSGYYVPDGVEKPDVDLKELILGLKKGHASPALIHHVQECSKTFRLLSKELGGPSPVLVPYPSSQAGSFGGIARFCQDVAEENRWGFERALNRIKTRPASHNNNRGARGKNTHEGTYELNRNFTTERPVFLVDDITTTGHSLTTGRDFINSSLSVTGRNPGVHMIAILKTERREPGVINIGNPSPLIKPGIYSLNGRKYCLHRNGSVADGNGIGLPGSQQRKMKQELINLGKCLKLFKNPSF